MDSGVAQTQINIFSGRGQYLPESSQYLELNNIGVLIESQGPSWFYASASEHAVLYQYNIASAQNIYMGMVSHPLHLSRCLILTTPDPNREPILPTLRNRPSTLHIQPQQVRLRPNLLRLRRFLPMFRRLGPHNLQLKQHPNHRCRSVLLLPKLQPKLHLLAKLPATTCRNDFQWCDLSVQRIYDWEYWNGSSVCADGGGKTE
jgi:hypothetical protein